LTIEEAGNSAQAAMLSFAIAAIDGWRLWYEPRLRMHHFMRKSASTGGICGGSVVVLDATAGLDPYEMAIKGPPGNS